MCDSLQDLELPVPTRLEKYSGKLGALGKAVGRLTATGKKVRWAVYPSFVYVKIYGSVVEVNILNALPIYRQSHYVVDVLVWAKRAGSAKRQVSRSLGAQSLPPPRALVILSWLHFSTKLHVAQLLDYVDSMCTFSG